MSSSPLVTAASLLSESAASLLSPATPGAVAASLVLASVGGQIVGRTITHPRCSATAGLLTVALALVGIAAAPAAVRTVGEPIVVNPWLAAAVFSFIVFGFVLVAEPPQRGPQAFGEITVMAHLARLNQVDDNGVLFSIAASKPPEFTVSQVKLHVEGEIWSAAGNLAPSALIWTVRNTMLPLNLCPKNLDPASVVSGQQRVETLRVHLGVGGATPDGTPGVAHSTILDGLSKLVILGDPTIVLRFDAGTCDLFTMKFKASALHLALRSPEGGVVYSCSESAPAMVAKAVPSVTGNKED